jgi:serine/threonine protein phosphatase PrpC
LTEAGQAKLRQFRGLEGSGNNNGQKVSGGTGCTGNVVLITKDKYYVANIGDSRAALAQKGKKAVQLSEDHKPES